MKRWPNRKTVQISRPQLLTISLQFSWRSIFTRRELRQRTGRRRFSLESHDRSQRFKSGSVQSVCQRQTKPVSWSAFGGSSSTHAVPLLLDCWSEGPSAPRIRRQCNGFWSRAARPRISGLFPFQSRRPGGLLCGLSHLLNIAGACARYHDPLGALSVSR